MGGLIAKIGFGCFVAFNLIIVYFAIWFIKEMFLKVILRNIMALEQKKEKEVRHEFPHQKIV